jgi:uncharacterized RDD family membrane protein YckC
VAIEDTGSEADRNRQGLFTRAARGASERVLDFVDPDLVLEHVDINALLDRVDVNTLLDRVDVNALLDRVDVDALMARADIDALMARVDIKAIVERAGIPEIVAESTGHLTGSALDLFRRPLVGIDAIVFRGLNRLIGRDPGTYPSGPSELVDWVGTHTEPEKAVETGKYGGPVTRLIALALDVAIVSTGFTLTLAGLSFLLNLIGEGYDLGETRGIWFAIGLVVFVFFYALIGLTVFGKTPGKAVMGLRVVGADGSMSLHGRQAFIRVVTYPLSFVIFGIGLLGVVFNKERRAWHDHFAGSAVVYDWGSRTARMPTPLADWLDRRQAEHDEESKLKASKKASD